MTTASSFRLRPASLPSPAGRSAGDQSPASVPPPHHLVIPAKAGIHFDLDLGIVADLVKRFFRLPPAESLFCSHRKVTKRCARGGSVVL